MSTAMTMTGLVLFATAAKFRLPFCWTKNDDLLALLIQATTYKRAADAWETTGGVGYLYFFWQPTAINKTSY